MLERIFPGASHLQNIHPIVVHFPIAFLCGAALLYFLAAVFGAESLEWAAFWSLILGTAGAAVSIATGLEAGEGVMVAESVRTALLDHHRNLMIATGVIAAALTAWALAARPMPSRFRWAFLAGLLVMCAVLARGVDYGGWMVFDYNAGGNACGQPIDFTK
ncbi:MAG: DUF2231 domain-containing protein [Candidatus Binataceae bacterium]